MRCQLDDISVHFEQAGAGRPLVFLHGWSLDHRYELLEYEPIFAARAGWRRIYLDLPGMGQTPAPSWLTNLDQMLALVLKFIEHVLPDQHFAIAGTSMGAYLARGVIYHKTPLITGVLFRVPLVIPDYSRRILPPAGPLIEDPAVLAALTPDEVIEFTPLLVQTRPFLGRLRSKMHTAVHPAHQVANRDFLDRIGLNLHSSTFSFDIDDPQMVCSAPGLFLLGRQDIAVGYHDAWALLECYPRATFAVLDRADHLLPIEQEAVFHALIHDWLNRVEEYLVH